MTLNEQAAEMLRIAEQGGVEQNFFFITTFKRYQVQLNMLSELEKAIAESGTMVTKEYVKSRENLYVNPALKEYNNTCNGANQTVATLMKIITTLRNEKGAEENELIKWLQKKKA